MTKRALAVLPALAFAAVSLTGRPVEAGPPTAAALNRVRPADACVRTLMDAGYQKSPTFRRLVQDLQKTDLIVYVSQVPYLPEPDAGALQLVGRAGEQRYVRVSIKKVPNPREFIAAVAHELRHAMELAENPGVVDEESLTALYRGIGRPSCNGYETAAARETGDLVCREMQK
ncbi:MAG: hypothetical protein EHM13_03120 [Acidobacteria bacterium]|nr:MAG: hypothetical protein EHM13_03120 [Acidobacteriota bacterium]